MRIDAPTGGNITSSGTIRPSTTSLDLGLTTVFWDNIYGNTSYFTDVTTSITRDSSNNLEFTDANAGTITLSELGFSTTALASETTISGLSNNLIFEGTDTTGSARTILDEVGVGFYLYTDPAYSTTNGYTSLTLSDDTILMRVTDSSLNYSGIQINPISGSMYVIDQIDARGFLYQQDYSTNGTANDRWLPDYGAVKDYVDDTANNIMRVARGQVLYSNTSQTTIVALDAGDVVWDIQVEILTAFNGGTDNELEIGISTDSNRYESLPDVNRSAEWSSMTLGNVPDRMTGSENITFTYVDTEGDASTGQAYVYIHYTKH